MEKKPIWNLFSYVKQLPIDNLVVKIQFLKGKFIIVNIQKKKITIQIQQFLESDCWLKNPHKP